MNTEQLKTFLTLAGTGNFSRTAEAMLLSQSAVSKRIQELERETGQRLFARDRSGVSLTPAGRVLREYAEQIVNLEERALEQVGQTGTYSGRLILGTAYAYYDTRLAPILNTLAVRFPEISIQVKFGHTGYLVGKLRRALVDVAFTHHPIHDPEIVCMEAGEDALVLVTDWKNQEYAEGIPLSGIRGLPFLDSNLLYQPTRKQLFPASHQSHLELEIASFTLPLLKDSGWYTILTEKQAEPFLASRELRRIPITEGELPPVDHYILYRKDNRQRELIGRVLEEVGGGRKTEE